MFPIFNFAYKKTMMKDGSGTRIEIETSEAERSFMRDRIQSISCTRHDGHRIIRLQLDPLCIFSREDERLLAHMIRRIDGIVESYVFDMHDTPIGLCIHFRRRYISADVNKSPKKTEFHGYCYSWTFSDRKQSATKTNASWPYLQHSLKGMTVGIAHGGSPRYSSSEKWEISGEPEGILLSAEGIVQSDDELECRTSETTMPARVIINGQSFPGETGLRLLKLRSENCPFPQWEDAWNVLTPLNFREITERIKDIDRRRAAISFLGIERLMEQIESRMICEETIEKLTTWLDENGQLREYKYADTYSLHRVRWTTLYGDLTDETNRLFNSNWEKPRNQHFVKCKCTSTGNEYILWVDLRQVYQTNHPEVTRQELDDISHWRIERLVDPIEAIAWTFETQLAKGSIEAIIRQGDCILMRPTINPVIEQNRHLTGQEYRTLIRAES